MPAQPLDEMFQILKIGAPVKGLMDGLDPALPDEEYSPLNSPDLENLRIAGGKWEPRKGLSLWQTLPGSGDVRWLTDFYRSNGDRYRIAARGTGSGALLYKLKEGTDGSFIAITGATGLGTSTQPYFHGAVNGDRLYVTDRAGALKSYDPSAGTVFRTVAQPVKPSTAPRVRSRWFDKLADWADLTAWSKSDNTKFDLVDETAVYPPPGGGNSVNVLIQTTNANGQTISQNSGNTLKSHAIAFWIYERIDARPFTQFGFGINAPDEYSQPLRAAPVDSWYPVFVPVGDVPSILYKQFKVLDASRGPNGMIVSSLYLPGYLSGTYRWRYTHYDPTSGRESAPSAVSNNGTPLDFSVEGATGDVNTSRAFQKCALLDFTSDSGTDATTTKIRIYRSGGVPSLTSDQSTGTDIWLRVGEVYDQATTINHGGGYLAGVTSMIVTAGTNLSVGDTLILDKGLSNEEYVTLLTAVGTTLGFTRATTQAHSNGGTVQVAFIDNVPNEQIDVTARIDLERDDAPAGAKFVSRAPDGRLWLFGYSGHPTGVAVSNKPTPDKPADYEVFPNGVDPLTRRHPLQGWRFDIGGDVNDEEIVWGGFFRGRATVLTKRNIYVIEAHSQTDWGPMAVFKVFNFGCIAPDSVKEVNGVLYWVAPGPRLMKWTGIQRYSIFDMPEVVSHLRANVRLQGAPTAYWNQWLGAHHIKQYGAYYSLFFTPSGATTNTQRLDYNTEVDVFEPCVFYGANGASLAWQGASTRDGGADTQDIYQVNTAGQVFQSDTGLLDNGVAIAIRGASKRFPLEMVSLLHTAWVRLTAATDSLTLTVTVGGGEYAQQSASYVLSVVGTNELEVKKRLDRTLKGRWAQVQISGSVSNGAAVREIGLWVLPVRAGRVSA